MSDQPKSSFKEASTTNHILFELQDNASFEGGFGQNMFIFHE